MEGRIVVIGLGRLIRIKEGYVVMVDATGVEKAYVEGESIHPVLL